MIHPEMLCPECEPQGQCRFMREQVAVDAARRDMVRGVPAGADSDLVGSFFQAAANRVTQEEIEPIHPQCPYNVNVRAHKN